MYVSVDMQQCKQPLSCSRLFTASDIECLLVLYRRMPVAHHVFQANKACPLNTHVDCLQHHWQVH